MSERPHPMLFSTSLANEGADAVTVGLFHTIEDFWASKHAETNSSANERGTNCKRARTSGGGKEDARTAGGAHAKGTGSTTLRPPASAARRAQREDALAAQHEGEVELVEGANEQDYADDIYGDGDEYGKGGEGGENEVLEQEYLDGADESGYVILGGGGPDGFGPMASLPFELLVTILELMPAHNVCRAAVV